MMSTKLSDIAILNINGAHYCYIISGINKSEVTKLMQNINLTKKRRILLLILLSHIKMGQQVLTFGHIKIETKILLP